VTKLDPIFSESFPLLLFLDRPLNLKASNTRQDAGVHLVDKTRRLFESSLLRRTARAARTDTEFLLYVKETRRTIYRASFSI
jgi:hypothetical protein